MTTITVFFHSSAGQNGPMYIKQPEVDGSVEELTNTFSAMMQNVECKTLVFHRKNGAHIINKEHILMIEVGNDQES